MGVHKRFQKQVIASIVDNSRSGMSVVAFCTAPPIGGLSCNFRVTTRNGFMGDIVGGRKSRQPKDHQ